MKYDLAAWGAELTPDRPAIWFSGRWYSYRDINERATRLANHLAAVGVSFGARVGIVASNHLAHFDLMFAAPKLGFVVVPFNPRHSAVELAEAVRITQPTLVFHDARCTAVTQQAFTCPRVTLDEYRGWLRNSSRRLIPPPQLSPESAQMILFTGGSTGTAKAALIPYRQTMANAQGTAMDWGLGPEDCAIQATPCYHAAVHVLSTPLLTIGGRVVLMSQFEPGEYLRLATRFEATVLFMVPSMYQALADHPEFASTDFHSVRWAISGGAPCPSVVAKALSDRGVPFRQGYGMTEAGVNCFSIPLDESTLHPESVGYPMPHVQAQVRRPDGTPCKPNETGELTLAGEALCSGYFNAQIEWKAAWRDGWFWTGDLAEYDSAGRYYIRGRRKDMYISGGENVFPAEVENALRQCAGVKDCGVVSIPDVKWGESGLAAIVCQPGTVRSADQLRSELRSRLAAYKIPSVMLFLDELPRTSVGKLDRSELRRRLEADAE